MNVSLKAAETLVVDACASLKCLSSCVILDEYMSLSAVTVLSCVSRESIRGSLAERIGRRFGEFIVRNGRDNLGSLWAERRMS